MAASARGAKEGGGKTIGVTTKDFGGPANRWVDQEIKMKKWSERLFKLIALGDGYVIFDGGTGTLAELFVAWEMSNKNFISKPIIVYSPELQNLVKWVRQLPHVIDNANVSLKKTPDEVLESLTRGLSKGS